MSQIAFPVLQDFSERCLNSTTATEITEPFDDIVRDRGIRQWYIGSLSFVTQGKGFGFDRIPSAWRTRYLEENHAQYDPVYRRAAKMEKKATWSLCKLGALSEPSSARALQVFDEAAEFGLTNGLVMPVHGFGDLPAAVSFGGDDIDLGEDAQASLYLIGALAYEGLRRTIEKFEPIAPILTEQELRILRWTAEGKSAESIAVLVKLSPHTVREYHGRLRAKYGVATMIQAVVHAALDGNLQIASRFSN